MWEIIAKQLGTVNNFPVGKHARRDIRNGKERGNQTLVIHIDVFCGPIRDLGFFLGVND